MYRLNKKWIPLALSAAITIQMTGCGAYDIVIDTEHIHITNIGNGILNHGVEEEDNIPKTPIEQDENNLEVLYKLDEYHYDNEIYQKLLDNTDKINTFMLETVNPTIHWETMEKENPIQDDYGTAKTYHSF